MGVWAEFEEKEFEALANAELVQRSQTLGALSIHSPGQVLERRLGYDFATRIDRRSTLYRRLFAAVPGVPAAGVPQGALAAHNIPTTRATRLLNLFLQYKRPEYFAAGHRSGPWRANQEFYRFPVAEGPQAALDFHQIEALHKLEGDFSGTGYVRYACPSTWIKTDLYERFADGTLLASSAFVLPSALLIRPVHAASPSPQFHRRWTFQPGAPDRGRPNPDGDDTSAENGEQFFESLRATLDSDGDRDPLQVFIEAASQTEPVRKELDDRRKQRGAQDRNRTSDRVINEMEAIRDEAATLKDALPLSGTERAAIDAVVSLVLTALELRTSYYVITG